MDATYRGGLNALTKTRDPRLAFAMQSVHIDSKRERNIATSSGLGEAIVQRRESKAAKRSKTKAARASRRRNR
jgi:hypothetical protein